MNLPCSPDLRELAASNPESISDHELMLLLCDAPNRQEQDLLFSEFHRRFQARVTAWCFRLTRSRSRAADLTQEVFLKAWRHIGSFRGDSRPTTWLYVITRNHCLTAIQRLAADPLESGAQLPARLTDTRQPHPDRRIERKQLSRDVCRLMTSALEPLEARVFTLHYGYEMPLGAITSRLALGNPSGAKAYIVNGRRKLKGALNRRGGAGDPGVLLRQNTA